jgi:hypothetical protein
MTRKRRTGTSIPRSSTRHSSDASLNEPPTAALKERSLVVRASKMPACRMCKQNYPQSQFITGNGPRYQVCARCGIENGLIDPADAPQYYSDEVLNARLSLYTRRHLPWATVFVGWVLYISMGRGIELWSGLFFGVLLVSTLVVPVLHFMGGPRFDAEISRISP